MDRFALLIQIHQPDDWDASTLDILRYSSLLLILGDVASYEQFRQSTVACYVGSTNPVSAERVIKMSLLTPASDGFLATLAPLEITLSNSLACVSLIDGWHRGSAQWQALSLALAEYRRGNYAGVEKWHDKAVTYNADNYTCDLMFQVVLGMAHYQAGNTQQARKQLASAGQIIERHFSQPSGNDDFWFDWVLARILLREATGLMAGSGG